MRPLEASYTAPGTNGRAMRTPTGDELLPPPRAVPLPRRGRSWGFRRSRPAALTSNQPKGFAVAPKPLRAPSRNIVVITVTGAAIYETGAQCAPADILPTFDFPIPIPPSSREGDRPAGGGRSPQAPDGVRNPAGRDFSLGGVPFMPLVCH